MMQQPAHATPFGQGVFGANNAFGSQTSLSMALGGNVSMALTSGGSTFSGSGSNTVTVTTNDAVGYDLYAYCPGSNTMTLTGGGDTIPASNNSTATTLATNTWGYNTTGSTTNFLGMLTSPTLIKNASGPYESGDTTTVTYGALTSATKSAGSYTVSVVYTAMPLQD